MNEILKYCGKILAVMVGSIPLSFVISILLAIVIRQFKLLELLESGIWKKRIKNN